MRNYGKFLKKWEYQTTLSVSWETCMHIKKQQLEPYIEQLTGSKLGKEYDKAVSCHPAYLTDMQSAAKSLQSCPALRPHRRQPTRLPRPWDSPGKNTGMGCHFLLQFIKVKSESEVAQSCPTLRDPMDCSLPSSSVHGIYQARVLEWVSIAFSTIET